MHWKHSKFETAHIILGNCHTYDEAYRVLRELEEDRNFAIQSSLAESKRAQSKVVTAKLMLDDPKESRAGKLLAECNIDEQAARKIIAQPCLDEARRELSFIRLLIEHVNPHRRYREYPDHVAHQLCQELEWRYDLHWKTFNYLCSAGMVPHDHIMLLRMHPASDKLLGGMTSLLEEMRNTDLSYVMMRSKREVLSAVSDNSEEVFDTQFISDERIVQKHTLSSSNYALSSMPQESQDEV